MASRARKLPAASADENTEANDNGSAVAVSAQQTDQRELAGLKKMLADAKAKSDREKAAQDVVFERGLNRDQREEKIIGLGYSPTQAAHIMMDKDTEDQHGNPEIKPGFTREHRIATARNLRSLEASVKRQESKMGTEHTGREEARREQDGQDAGNEGRTY